MEPDPRRIPRVAEDGMRLMLVKLGEKWGRTATLWRDGGLVKAYYRPNEERPPEDSYVALQWEREAESYYGHLEVAGFGPDRALLEQVLRIGREVLPAEAFEEEAPEKPETAAEALPGREPSAAQRDEPLVAISFAGSDDRAAVAEQVPLALKQALGRAGLQAEHYRMEQARSEGEKRLQPQAYLEYLAARDFIVVVLTEKYLTSEWCLYEAMRLYERLVDGDYNHGTMRLRAFPEAWVSPGDDARRVELQRRLTEAWERQVNAFNAAYAEMDFTEADRLAKKSPLRPWIEFAGLPGNREKLAGALLVDWFPKPLAGDRHPDEVTLADWVAEIRASLADPAPMFELAKKAWRTLQEERDEAGPEAEFRRHRLGRHVEEAYREGLRRKHGEEAWKEWLRREEADAELEVIRRWMVADG